ncbi:MAG: hypothetical protein NVS4B10_24750 [Myxococcales bacterium]
MLRSLIVASLLCAPTAGRSQAAKPGEIDWQRRVIRAQGHGAPDLNAPSISVARLGAERAAKLSAVHNLFAVLQGAIAVPGANLAATLRSDRGARTRTEGALRAFKVVAPHYYSDGGIALDVEADLDKLPPEIGRLLQPPPGAQPAGSRPAAATPVATASPQPGFIVDASASKVALGHAPRVVDEAGAQVYGPDAVDPDALAAQGTSAYAAFARSPEEARKDARLASGASVVTAVRVSASGNEVVVSRPDAEKLRGSPGALREGRVVFVSADPAGAGPAKR